MNLCGKYFRSFALMPLNENKTSLQRSHEVQWMSCRIELKKVMDETFHNLFNM